MPLPEKQGVGSSILPLATINIGLFSLHNQTFKNCDQNCDDALASFIESYAVSSFSKKFSITPSGIIYLGAHSGEEIALYEQLFKIDIPQTSLIWSC